MKTATYTFPTHLLAAMQPFCAGAGESRKFLRGVILKDGLLMASNGVVAAYGEGTDEFPVTLEGVPDPIILQPDLVKGALRAAASGSTVTVHAEFPDPSPEAGETGDEGPALTVTFSQSKKGAVTGMSGRGMVWPVIDIRRVIPAVLTPVAGQLPQISVEVLGQISDARKAVHRYGVRRYVLFQMEDSGTGVCPWRLVAGSTGKNAGKDMSPLGISGVLMPNDYLVERGSVLDSMSALRAGGDK